MQDYKKRVFQDILIISMSILFAIGLINTRVLESLLASSLELEMMGSFIAGMFFTSIFTTVPSMVALGEIARINNVFLTAVFGKYFIETIFHFQNSLCVDFDITGLSFCSTHHLVNHHFTVWKTKSFAFFSCCKQN